MYRRPLHCTCLQEIIALRDPWRLFLRSTANQILINLDKIWLIIFQECQKAQKEASSAYSKSLASNIQILVFNFWFIIVYKIQTLMTTFTKPGFYSQLQSAYNLDEACMMCSTQENSQNCQGSIVGKGKHEKRTLKHHRRPNIEKELSFDQDFLRQHLKVMEKYLPIFSRIEERNKHRNHHISGLNLSPCIDDITQIDNNRVNMEKGDSSQSQQASAIFSRIVIQGNQDLREFVEKCLAKVERSARNAFLAMSNMFWGKFCKVGEFIEKQGSIIKYSQAILGKLLNEVMQLIGLHHLEVQQMKDFTQFLQVYFITFLLVANQYFQNPYFEEETSRSLEEDSDLDLFDAMERKNCQHPRKIVHQV